MISDFKDYQYKHIVQDCISDVYSEGDTVVVALSTLAFRLLEYVYEKSVNRPKIILADALPICVSYLKERNVRCIVCFDIFEPDIVEMQQIQHGLAVNVPECHVVTISAIQCIEKYSNPNTGTRVHILNELSELLSQKHIMPYIGFPLLSFNINEAEGIDVLDEIKRCNTKYTSCPLYQTDVYGVKLLTFLLHTTTQQTYGKIHMWYDADTHTLYIVPASPTILPDDQEYLNNLFKKTYNAIVWDQLLSYNVFRSPSEVTTDMRSALCTIANYLYSFDNFLYFLQSWLNNLNGEVSWKIGHMSIDSNQLLALCGIEECVNAITDELLQAYSLNFRLKPLNSLAEHEQKVQTQFEKTNWLDPSDDNTNQSLFLAFKKAESIEEILEACYTATGHRMGYPVAALLRAANIGKTSDLDEKKCLFYIHQWLDVQIIKGCVQPKTALQLGYLKNVFCSGYNEFECPTQLARLVLNVFRRIKAILHRNDLPKNLLSGAITLSLMASGIKQIGSTKILFQNRKTIVCSSFGKRDIVDLLIRAGVLRVTDENTLTIEDRWLDGDYIKQIGFTEEKSNELLRNVAQCLHPLSSMPLQLYNYVFNIYFFPSVDLNEAYSKNKAIYDKVIKNLEYTTIAQNQDTNSISDLNVFIVRTHFEVRDYVILWGMFEPLLHNVRYVKSLIGSKDLFISLQKLVQLINFDLKMMQFLLVLRNPKYALETLKGVMSNFTLNGTPLFQLDNLYIAIENLEKNINTGNDGLERCIVELIKVNKQAYE